MPAQRRRPAVENVTHSVAYMRRQRVFPVILLPAGADRIRHSHGGAHRYASNVSSGLTTLARCSAVTCMYRPVVTIEVCPIHFLMV